MINNEIELREISGWLGVFGVSLFLVSLLIFGNINPKFRFFNDLISMLGARGEPNALWWNITGFGLVGAALFGFGITYGKVIKDKLVGILLSFFGIGFAVTAIPIDLIQPDIPNSKAHIAAITVALAFWLLGLAKISSNLLLDLKIRHRANAAAILIVSVMVGSVFFKWPMPVTQRFVFMFVFVWTAITARSLLQNNKLVK